MIDLATVVTGADGVRELRGSDGPAIARASDDASIRHWLPIPRDLPVAAYTAWADESPALRADGLGLRLAVDVDGSLGVFLEVRRVDHRAASCEISYWTAPAARMSGRTATAVRQLTGRLVRSAGFRRVELRIAPANAASTAVAVRAGFVEEGTLRRAGFLGDGTVTDLAVWSCTDVDLASVTRPV